MYKHSIKFKRMFLVLAKLVDSRLDVLDALGFDFHMNISLHEEEADDSRQSFHFQHAFLERAFS